MFQKEQTGKKNSARVVVGYDLGSTFSQISFCYIGENEPETISAVAGTEQYNIPAVLCKRKGVGQWYYGKEALKFAQEETGILVENLLELAQNGEDVLVENETFDPVALLTLYVKRSLSLLNLQISPGQVEAFMLTVEELTPRMVAILEKVVAGLQLKTQHICFQSHMESFYYYVLHQEQELRKSNVVIFEYNDYLKSLRLECNHKTQPKVVFIQMEEFPEIKRIDWAEDEGQRESQKLLLDEEFGLVVEKSLKDEAVSTIYLLGDGFKEGWSKSSLRILCRNRRVFQGNNLYSKGACYGMLERIAPTEEAKNFVYLGEDKLKSNIGMKVLRRGTDSYFAVMDAGKNWYEATADFEIILESGNMIDFIVTPLTGGQVTSRPILLEGLPERPKKATRLRIHMEMSAVDQAAVTIEDLGFGEIFLSSGKAWTQTFLV